MFRRCSVSLSVWLLLSGSICAQQQPTLTANLPTQKLGSQDLISLSVYGAPELSRTIRVGSDGSIRLPILKSTLMAQGLYPDQLEPVIAAALHKEQILVDPVVTVNVVEYASRPISVAGAVKKPLTFQSIGATTLLDAITKAEGLSETAGPEILVTRHRPAPDGKTMALVQRVPVKGLIDAADESLNLRLSGGEEIRVPEAGKIFVVGNVRKPGSYPISDAGDTTILKMLAVSEGLMPYASKHAYIYRRESNTGVKHEIPIELRKIMDRKAPDVPLQQNDILYVPDNSGRRAGLSALEKIVAFGAATASGVLIYGGVR